MDSVNGPDFICVRMPKAGTGWLYYQLAAHSDFWMPPVKEIVYLNQDYPILRFVRGSEELLRASREGTAQMAARSRRALDERLVNRASLDARDAGFLTLAREGLGKPRGLDFVAF